jgi:hypothetical protein
VVLRGYGGRGAVNASGVWWGSGVVENRESGYESGFGLEGLVGLCGGFGGVVKGSGGSGSCVQVYYESIAVLVSWYP